MVPRVGGSNPLIHPCGKSFSDSELGHQADSFTVAASGSIAPAQIQVHAGAIRRRLRTPEPKHGTRSGAMDISGSFPQPLGLAGRDCGSTCAIPSHHHSVRVNSQGVSAPGEMADLPMPARQHPGDRSDLARLLRSSYDTEGVDAIATFLNLLLAKEFLRMQSAVEIRCLVAGSVGDTNQR